jgi:hypothetical protein
MKAKHYGKRSDCEVCSILCTNPCNPSSLGYIEALHSKAIARQARDEAMRSLGLAKVRDVPGHETRD